MRATRIHSEVIFDVDLCASGLQREPKIVRTSRKWCQVDSASMRGQFPARYFHGGGFVLNGLETHDGLMRLIAAEAGVAVCAVSYSLAPEHRFPTQLLEAVAAIAWLRENADDMAMDASRIAVGGDS